MACTLKYSPGLQSDCVTLGCPGKIFACISFVFFFERGDKYFLKMILYIVLPALLVGLSLTPVLP